MEKLFKKPIVICVMALICCALWGSAFPCVKIGYELLQIETAGSQILFAGYRFFGAGILTFLMGCIIEKRVLTLKNQQYHMWRESEFFRRLCSISFSISEWLIQPE